MRHSTLLFLFVAGVLSLGLFLLKYEVQDQERELASLNRSILETRQATHVLEAEWSYLNDSTRLAKLATQYLGLKPITPSQLGSLDTLPERKPDAPAVATTTDGKTTTRVAKNEP